MRNPIFAFKLDNTYIDNKIGIIPPNTLIPLAEELGYIIPIVEWVQRKACEQNKAWQDAGLPPLCVAVNLSAVQSDRMDLETVIKNHIMNKVSNN